MSQVGAAVDQKERYGADDGNQQTGADACQKDGGENKGDARPAQNGAPAWRDDHWHHGETEISTQRSSFRHGREHTHFCWLELPEIAFKSHRSDPESVPRRNREILIPTVGAHQNSTPGETAHPTIAQLVIRSAGEGK